MPALSKKQQKFMGIVRSIQKGEQPASKFSKDARDAAKDMKKSSVKKFAGTKHKGLPMKKEVLKKLKEMIRQELSEYTYGSGDIVKDVNPTCPHYGAMGKVKSVGPRSVVFVVMNKGKNFKPGMELEKSHDQMKKMNENKVVKVGDRKYKLTPLNSIPQIEKLAYNGKVSYRGLGVFGAKVFELSINTKVWHAASVKQKEQYFISNSDLDKLKKKVDDSPFLAGGLPFSGTLKGWKPIKPDDRVGIVSNLKESVNENKVYKVGDTVSLLSFDRRHRGRAKVKGVTKSRANKFGIKNHYITNKGTFTDMEVEGTEAFKLRFKGDTEKKVTKAMNSPYGVVLPEQSVNEAITGSNRKELLKIGKEIKDNLFRINPALKKVSDDRLLIRGLANTFMFMRYTPDNANYKNYKKYFPKNFKSSSVQKLANILQNEPETVRKTFFKQVVKESINEMSAKSKKIINKLGKKEKEMFMDMIDIMGFDQVMADYKKDKKAFKQALKDMSEGVIQEKISVKSSKEYFDNLDTAINLIVRQANNLKGQLGKHPIKQNVNKLKAVKTMLKRGISPAFYAYEKDRSYSPSFKATDLNYIKKSLQDGKFRRAVSELIRAIDTRSYDSNDFYFLKDKKEDKLRQRLVGVLKDLVNKMENAQLENINEDGHTDVASSKRKVMLMVDDSNKLLNKLNGMNLEDSLPSWWTDKITLSQKYLAKATDYLLNPVESVNEFRNKREADTALDQIGPKALYMIGAKDFVFGTSGGKKSLVFKIMRNSKGVSHIRMRLTSLDLYDMEFLAIRAGKIKVKSKEKGVYGDQLGVMIKKNTGLNVRL